MEITEGTLKSFRQPVENALEGYAQAYKGLSFQKFEDFQLTPEKGYTAKTKVPVSYLDQKAGDLVVVVLQPRDGTGSEEDYRLNAVQISEEFRERGKQEKVIPRRKREKGIICEGYFPLFSKKVRGGEAIPFSGCLIGTILSEDQRIVKGFALGQAHSEYANSFYQKPLPEVKPKIQLTVGNDENGKRFGDPHAIFNHNWIFLQIAGFLAIEDPRNPLMDLAKTWEMPCSSL